MNFINVNILSEWIDYGYKTDALHIVWRVGREGIIVPIKGVTMLLWSLAQPATVVSLLTLVPQPLLRYTIDTLPAKQVIA